MYVVLVIWGAKLLNVEKNAKKRRLFLKIGQQLGPYYNAKRAVLEIKTTPFYNLLNIIPILIHIHGNKITA